jgi:hypothetical protein
VLEVPGVVRVEAQRYCSLGASTELHVFSLDPASTLGIELGAGYDAGPGWTPVQMGGTGENVMRISSGVGTSARVTTLTIDKPKNDGQGWYVSATADVYKG